MHLSTLHVVFGLLFSATAAVIEGDRNAYVDVEKMTSYSCALNCYRNVGCKLGHEKLYDLCGGPQAKRIQNCVDRIVAPCIADMCHEDAIPEIMAENRDFYDGFCSIYHYD